MKFHEYIAAHLATPFVWGQHDCVLFASRWIEQATGKNFLAEYPSWENEREARRLMKRLGGLELLLDKHFVRINPNFAPDGSLTLYDGALCLFSGPYIVGPGPDGLTHIKRTEAKCAWSY